MPSPSEPPPTSASSHGQRPLPSRPPEAWDPAQRLVRIASRPIERFLAIEASSGILLVIVAAMALVWANSAGSEVYFGLREHRLGFAWNGSIVDRTLEWVVNDILMTIFFFVVGMEIRREIHQGELSELRRAALPAAAALGGMIAPAGIYLLLAGGPETHSGWGVPMATDIAFAVGILTLLGKRVPPALRVLLLALAVIDDLGAILVIAFFYSSGIEASGLLLAAGGVLGIFAMQAVAVRSPWLYVIPSAVVWLGAYSAGMHPTIAGVMVGLLTPVRAWFGQEGAREEISESLGWLAEPRSSSGHDTHAVAGVLKRIELARREALSPSERLTEALHPWVAYAIMPVFALFNAGVMMGAVELEGSALDAAVGVFFGLLVGKPLGVVLACLLAVKTGIAVLPRGIGLRELIVLGLVAGVGFTMALFIGQLAYGSAELLGAAKLGILAASGVAAVGGLLAGRLLLREPTGATDYAQSEHDAERSTEA